MRFTLPPARGQLPGDDSDDATIPHDTTRKEHGTTDAPAGDRLLQAVRHPSVWWTTQRTDASGGAVSSPQRTFADNSKPVADAVDNALKWLGVLLPVYLTIRIFGFSDFRSSVALEVVRQQGVSGIAEAALASLFSEIAGLVVLAGAVLLLRQQEPPRDDGQLARRRLLGAVLVAVGMAFAPLIVVAITALLLLTMWGRNRIAPVAVGVVLAAVSVTVPAVSSAWVPHERLTLPGAGTEGSECYLDGYVLGRESGTYYSVMVRSYADPQGPWGDAEPCGTPTTRVRLAAELGTRVICAAPETGWDRVDLSAVRWVAGDVRPCAAVPRQPGTEPLARPQRVLAGSVFRPAPLPESPRLDQPCRGRRG